MTSLMPVSYNTLGTQYSSNRIWNLASMRSAYSYLFFLHTLRWLAGDFRFCDARQHLEWAASQIYR